MNLSMLLFGILPLVIFVVIDTFAGIRTGVLAAVVFAVAEAGYSLWFYKTIDGLTIGSTLLVLVFGGISYMTENPIFIKLQPVFLGGIFGVVVLVMQYTGNPILVLISQKYQYLFPEEFRDKLASPFFLEQMGKLSHVLGWGFLVHALLVWYAAYYMSSWWWLIIRGVGLYVMMFLCVLFARMV